MRTKPAVLFLIFTMAACMTAAAADTYAIDPVHSYVGFSVTHLTISQVRGNFEDFSGTIVYDPQDASKSSVEVHIKAASLDTRNKTRDADVLSPHYLDADKYPEIVFKSTKVEKSGDSYVAHGQLTIHGVTKDVDLPFKITGQTKDPWGKFRIAAEAELTINRMDYGVAWNATLEGGGAVVGKDVKISLTVEAVKP
jgi:polyisoprenoid-binding protein YceI